MLQDPSSRRRFLEILAQGSALAGAACLGACGGAAAGPIGKIAAGNVSALAEGALNVVAGHPLVIGRDAGGVYAMTLVCTHASCDMTSQGSVSAQEITCFCHGSRFDANGAVLGGPANAPLDHFEVTISSAGEMTVNADQTVGATVRTAVT